MGQTGDGRHRRGSLHVRLSGIQACGAGGNLLSGVVGTTGLWAADTARVHPGLACTAICRLPGIG